MMALDLLTYPVGSHIGSLYRAAMSVSLETRVPSLDHRVIEFAWRLPISMKLRNGQSKWALRQVLYKYVPKHLIERPKMGFAVPIDSWLRGPLQGLADELLNERTLRDEGYFDPAPVRKKWKEHLAGTRNWQNQLSKCFDVPGMAEEGKGVTRSIVISINSAWNMVPLEHP